MNLNQLTFLASAYRYSVHHIRTSACVDGYLKVKVDSPKGTPLVVCFYSSTTALHVRLERQEGSHLLAALEPGSDGQRVDIAYPSSQQSSDWFLRTIIYCEQDVRTCGWLSYIDLDQLAKRTDRPRFERTGPEGGSS